MVNQFIQTLANTLLESLEAIKTTGAKQYYTFIIDCDTLKDYNHNDIRTSPEYIDTFNVLMDLKGPVLYWFEIVSDTPGEVIRNSISQYSKDGNSKATPALKKTFVADSRCLYVGKVKRDVWGRMIQHLGFYKESRTQGLQIFHWSKGLGLNLRVHLYVFESDISEIVSVFEIALAKNKNPIIGKHK